MQQRRQQREQLRQTAATGPDLSIGQAFVHSSARCNCCRCCCCRKRKKAAWLFLSRHGCLRLQRPTWSCLLRRCLVGCFASSTAVGAVVVLVAAKASGFNGSSALADAATAKANVCATILGLFPVGGPLPECLPGSNAYADRLLFLQVRF